MAHIFNDKLSKPKFIIQSQEFTVANM
uniref:Uncharacterized protein n=1 Tax=Arundo donax TaxID=35708 RepID=A0A0A9B9L9_ARUDO